jgi:hypothetical protein
MSLVRGECWKFVNAEREIEDRDETRRAWHKNPTASSFSRRYRRGAVLWLSYWQI